MLDEIRGMVVFARVIEHGSFAEAARKLGVSRAAVSHQIKKMEDRLGTRLLHRNTRNLSLTDVGKGYYQSCKLIAEEAFTANQKAQSLRDEPMGRIAITCSANFGLKRVVPILSSFRKKYPKVELDVELTDENINLIGGGYDLALRAGPLPDSEMMARKLVTITRHICASRSYLEEFGTPTTPDDLAAHHWITYSRQATHFTFTSQGKKYRINTKSVVQTNNAAARLRFVQEGHGLAILPASDLENGSADQITTLFPHYQLPQLDIFAVYPVGAASTMKVRMLIDHLATHL